MRSLARFLIVITGLLGSWTVYGDALTDSIKIIDGAKSGTRIANPLSVDQLKSLLENLEAVKSEYLALYNQAKQAFDGEIQVLPESKNKKWIHDFYFGPYGMAQLFRPGFQTDQSINQEQAFNRLIESISRNQGHFEDYSNLGKRFNAMKRSYKSVMYSLVSLNQRTAQIPLLLLPYKWDSSCDWPDQMKNRAMGFIWFNSLAKAQYHRDPKVFWFLEHGLPLRKEVLLFFSEGLSVDSKGPLNVKCITDDTWFGGKSDLSYDTQTHTLTLSEDAEFNGSRYFPGYMEISRFFRVWIAENGIISRD